LNKNTAIYADLLLLLVAGIWGTTFVVQRLGMDYIGPFTYTGFRFALASLVLVPVLTVNFKKIRSQLSNPRLWQGGLWLGLFISGVINLQQIGLLFTTVTNAGFITGLYVVIVPILGLFFKVESSVGVWLGVICAVVGMSLLSVTSSLTIASGDLIQLASTILWAAHVLLVAHYARQFDAVLLALIQFMLCSIISLVLAFIVEDIEFTGISAAMPALLYGGVLAAGFGFTIQIVAQRYAIASHAAIILSSEALFAACAGAIFLGESLTMRGYIGCALMFAGILLAQLWPKSHAKLNIT